jgi:hypothetical protein
MSRLKHRPFRVFVVAASLSGLSVLKVYGQQPGIVSVDPGNWAKDSLPTVVLEGKAPSTRATTTVTPDLSWQSVPKPTGADFYGWRRENTEPKPVAIPTSRPTQWPAPLDVGSGSSIVSEDLSLE